MENRIKINLKRYTTYIIMYKQERVKNQSLELQLVIRRVYI